MSAVSGYAAAIVLHERGFHVFPADHPDHPECIGKHGPSAPCDGDRGKHPAVKWGVWALAPTPQMIKQAWVKHGGVANTAVAAGPSNLVILDEDAPGEVERWCVTHGITLPETYTVTTGRGRHLYYRWDHTAQRIGNSPKAMDGFKIDVRGHGGYAIAEGSRHQSGAIYTSDGQPVADLPEEVANILLAGAGTNGQAPRAEAPAEAVGEGPNTTRIEFHHRHHALVAYAGRLRNSGLDHAEALPVFRERWLLCEQPTGQIPEARFHSATCPCPKAACPYPVTWEEAQAKLRDVYGRYAAGRNLDEDNAAAIVDSKRPAQIHRGQARFAYLLADDEDDRLLHVYGIGWHYWDGTRWRPDDKGRARRAVLALNRRQWGNAIGDKELQADCRKCDTATGMNGVLEIASALEPFAVNVDDLDTDPYLFNAANGTLDLHTLALQQFSTDDRITKIANGAYDPAAASPLWNAFLAKVLPDEDVRAFVQRLAGLALLGEVREHILAIFNGTGRNGKSTLYMALLYTFGDYGLTAEPDLFTHRENAHPTGQLDLLGKRFVVVSESDQGRRLAEATMKRLTGGDPVTARAMRKDNVTFTPSHLPVMVTNHLPRVSGDDPAIWARILVVPFNVVIPEAQRDTELGAKLRLEADGILTWCVAGLRDYLDHGLAAPESVRVATDEYQRRQDAVGRFIVDCCTTTPAVQANTAQLYEGWQRWAEIEGCESLTRPAFGASLDAHGYPAGKPVHGKRWRKGIWFKGLPDDGEDG